MISFRRTLQVSVAAVAIIGLAGPALAGPPLVCFPFDIGTAASLPWNTESGSFKGMRPDYDRSRLNGDTLALLTPSTPIVVRMETLRRAALYAAGDATLGHGLLGLLRARAAHHAADALARFDAGYLIETYRQMAPLAPEMARMVADVDGYAMVIQSLEARQGDPAMAFAAALMTLGGKPLHEAHVRAARAGAATDVLLARNLDHVSR
jgi:NADPH-dependent 2,4-dienoyl-CoA reductase/sulfur reductase-like enzyme